MIEQLQQLGLSLNESKIYTALLDLKEANAGQIAKKTAIHRRNVYDTLNRLIDKGLIFPVVSQKETLYSPVDPDKLLELLKEKEIALQNALPQLNMIYKKREGTREAYIYKGLAGMKRYMQDILREGKNVDCLGAKLGWFDPRLKSFREQFYKEVRRKKMKLRNIFDTEAKEAVKKFARELNKDDNRFLAKQYSTQSAIDIFGDYVVTFTGLKVQKVDDDTTFFVMKDKNLAKTYRAWFQFIFDNCPKN